MKEKLKELGRLYIEEIANGNYIITEKVRADVYATLTATGDQVYFTVDPIARHVRLDPNMFTPSIIDKYVNTTLEQDKRILESFEDKIKDTRKEAIREEIHELVEKVKELQKQLETEDKGKAK